MRIAFFVHVSQQTLEKVLTAGRDPYLVSEFSIRYSPQNFLRLFYVNKTCKFSKGRRNGKGNYCGNSTTTERDL